MVELASVFHHVCWVRLLPEGLKSVIKPGLTISGS